MADKEAAPVTPEAIVCCTYPDFCVRNGQPVAFDIHALESADVRHSADVQITGYWASNADSRLSTVLGDAPADAGVNSGCVGGFARPVAAMSSTVWVNGKPCVRHDTEFEMNCAGPEGPFNTKGKMVYDRGGGGAAVDSNGQPTTDTDPPLSQEDQAKLSEDGGGFWEDGFGYDLKNQAGNFWDGFSGTVNGALDTAISAGKAVHQLGAFVAQDLQGQDPSLIYDPSELAAGEAAIGGTAQGVVDLVTNPIDTLGAMYDGSVDAFATAFERIAAGDAAALAGELTGAGALGLATGGVGALAGRLRGLASVLDRARAAGKLDGLIDSGALSKLDDAELTELQGAGKLTDAEVEKVRAQRDGTDSKKKEDEETEKEGGAGQDGVTVHKNTAAHVYDESDVDPEDRYDGETHRGDSRTPEEIEAAGGFKGTDPNARISAEQHLMKDRPPSQFVSTSQQAGVAEYYAFTDGRGGIIAGRSTSYVYHIQQPGGINLNSISAIAQRTGNFEIAFSRGIPFSSVSGWTRIDILDGRLVRTYVPNPAFVPPPGG